MGCGKDRVRRKRTLLTITICIKKYYGNEEGTGGKRETHRCRQVGKKKKGNNNPIT